MIRGLTRGSWWGAPLLTVLLIAVAGVAAGCGGGAVSTTAGKTGAASLDRYTSPAGWSVSRPPGLHLERSGVTDRLTVSEVTIASFVPRPPIHSWSKGNSSGFRVDPPLDVHGRFPSGSVAFRIMSEDGGPGPDVELPETRFPLRLAAFRHTDAHPGDTPRPVGLTVVAAGRNYQALVWIGARAVARVRADLGRVIASLSFPRLRPGTTVGYGFRVFRLSGRYPVGSFTRVRVQGAPFYLIRAPGGFYAIGWRWQSISGGYKSRCDLRLDAASDEFFCTNLAARWDRIGRVLTRPATASFDDPLNVTVAKVGWDGHVLLFPGVARFAGARYARRLWPGWRPR